MPTYIARSSRNSSLHLTCSSKMGTWAHDSTKNWFASRYRFIEEKYLSFFSRRRQIFVHQRVPTFCIVRLIDCNSHKLRLVIEKRVYDQSKLASVLDCLSELMSKIRTLKNSARLRELTYLRALFPNDTCWSGKSDMAEQLFCDRGRPPKHSCTWCLYSNICNVSSSSELSSTLQTLQKRVRVIRKEGYGS